MGMVRSRTTPPLDPPGELSDSGSGSASRQQTTAYASSKYYRFERFWILLLSIFLLALLAVMFVLAMTIRVLEAYYIIIFAVSSILVLTFGYLAVFVTISEFHAPLGTTIETHLEKSEVSNELPSEH